MVALFVLIFHVVGYCQDKMPEKFIIPYNFDQPSEKYILPGVLMEISGINLLNEKIMICIQDEKGDLFFYDMNENRLIKKIGFGKDADYEDLAKVEDEVYILRSNGTLIKLTGFESSDKIKTKEIKTRLSKKNNCEGLCYDQQGNRLLIALKGDPETSEDQNFEGYKAIYAFDIAKEIVEKKPVFLLDLNRVKDMENVSSYEKIYQSVAGTFEESGDMRFQPSAIAIHPASGNIYILASVGKSIIVMNRKGEILSIRQLDEDIFRQPEGIAFSPDGTLYISNEGDGKNGTILMFEMKE